MLETQETMDVGFSFTFNKAEIDFIHHITPAALADGSALLGFGSPRWPSRHGLLAMHTPLGYLYEQFPDQHARFLLHEESLFFHVIMDLLGLFRY